MFSAGKSEGTILVFDYLKEHHGLLTVCVSALVAIMSFLINMIAYLYQRIILGSWNIDARIVDLSVRSQLFYYVVASLLYCISLFVFRSQFGKMFANYSGDREKGY